jgi:hypothetical protein
MAKQEGILKLSNTQGNLTLYRSKEGFMTCLKMAVAHSHLKTDPAFQRTKKNMEIKLLIT